MELSEAGKKEAKSAGKILKEQGYDFDICYTSYLKRAIQTLEIALDTMDRNWLPVIKSWKLNERHYGALQGLNKSDTAKKYGEEKVKIWRRSFDVTPPFLDEWDERNPKKDVMYRQEEKEFLPLGESLKDTIDRVIPYFEEAIRHSIQENQRGLLVAHGNSLRALMKYLEGYTPEEILRVNIPTGIPLVYELDESGRVLSKEYLGDQDTINAKIQAVVQQGTANRE